MEKKLPEDNLERFLRSSFEKFGDSPSAKVWDRIEAGIGGQPAVSPRRIPGFVWTAAAGLVGILAIFVFILVRSNQELKAELKQVQTHAQKNEMNDLNEMETRNAEYEKKTEGAVNENERNERNEGNERNESNDAVKVDNSLTAGNSLAESKNQESLPLEKKNESTPGKSEKRTDPGNRERKNKQMPVFLPAGKTTDEILIVREKEAVALKTADQKEQVETLVNQVQISSGSLPQIALNELVRESKSVLSAPAHSLIFIATNPARGRSTLGLTGGLLSERGTIKPPRPFDPRDTEQAKNTYHTQNSWQAGLELERTLGSLSITGGLNFKHFEFVNEINHSLAFRNRQQHNPGRPPHQHDFSYRMDGPTGASEFEINSEQLDSRATIDDSEMIKVNIVNRSALNYLSIPVTAGYHFHFGRGQAFVKAGMQSDLLISRAVDAPVVSISHPQLALKNNKPPTSTMPINSIGFNGMVQAGVKYRLGSRWGLQLSPAWLIPLSRRDPHIRSNAQAYSLQAGLTYALTSL